MKQLGFRSCVVLHASGLITSKNTESCGSHERKLQKLRKNPALKLDLDASCRFIRISMTPRPVYVAEVGELKQCGRDL